MLQLVIEIVDRAGLSVDLATIERRDALRRGSRRMKGMLMIGMDTGVIIRYIMHLAMEAKEVKAGFFGGIGREFRCEIVLEISHLVFSWSHLKTPSKLSVFALLIDAFSNLDVKARSLFDRVAIVMVIEQDVQSTCPTVVLSCH